MHNCERDNKQICTLSNCTLQQQTLDIDMELSSSIREMKNILRATTPLKTQAKHPITRLRICSSVFQGSVALFPMIQSHLFHLEG